MSNFNSTLVESNHNSSLQVNRRLNTVDNRVLNRNSKFDSYKNDDFYSFTLVEIAAYLQKSLEELKDEKIGDIFHYMRTFK